MDSLNHNSSFISQVDLMLRSHYYPLLYIVAIEEEPIESALTTIADQSQRQIFLWDIVRGWNDNNADKGSIMSALLRISNPLEKDGTLFVMKGLYPFLKTPYHPSHIPIIRQLKNLARELTRTRRTLIITSHTLEIPDELTEEITVIDFPLPNILEISDLIRSTIAPEAIKLAGLGWEQLVKACQGLSRMRIHRVLAKALALKQQIDDSDIEAILWEKQRAIKQTGILEFFATQDSLKSVGGLENLKAWVKIRQNAFTEEARRYGIPNPKGILLVGIQGTGKSLSAKTIAHEWRLPLLRLDTGRIFSGIVGESESRVRQMIQLVEAIAPCVLWIDEIDKAFGNISQGSDGDSGTSRRVFGSLITWMQEKTTPVFIVATANNVQILPAELLRKGRFDEIFFLNLPTDPERQEIFKVHLQRLRPNRLREFNLGLLAQESQEFSGAEIEQVIIDAMHCSFSELNSLGNSRRDFTTADILLAIKETVPLAAIARDQINNLKRWAAETGARTASNDLALSQELKRYANWWELNN